MSDVITHDHSDDGVDRRGFLKCMAWAGTGMLWTITGGIPTSAALGRTILGSASDVGKNAADCIFMGDRLMPVVETVRMARRTQAVVRQNFMLAIVYNVIAVPLAFAGLVTPLIAAVAMSGSSLLVVGNALRLKGAIG